MHIRFQQGEAHLAHRRVHVRFGEFAAAAELVKDLVESTGKIFKHYLFPLESGSLLPEKSRSKLLDSIIVLEQARIVVWKQTKVKREPPAS